MKVYTIKPQAFDENKEVEDHVDIDITVDDVKNEEAIKMTLYTSYRNSYQGSLESIKEVFSEPTFEGGDGYKTDEEWVIQTPAGVATIYNWKNGKNYLEEHGLETEDITEWSIGGHNLTAAAWVKWVLELSKKENVHKTSIYNVELNK